VSARPPPPRQPVPDGGIVPEPQPGTPERELRGSKAAVDLLERFTPLLATRDLGVLPEPKPKELGLDTATKKLTVVTRAGSQVFSVSTGTTANAPYLRRQSDGRVFILGGMLIADLDGTLEGPSPGGRLVERQLHGFKLEPNDEVVIRAKERSRELVAIPSETPFNVKLAPKGQPATPDVFAKNWHDKLLRLPAQELLGKGEAPAGGVPRVELRLDYHRGTKPLGFLEAGHSGRDVYVRTEHTAGWVKVPATADEVLQEAEKVVAGT
jgi:hypothetical protein